MVVQCPTCQSKFRIADEKVTDRGVRVRCTSCKNVFPVRKAGASGGDSTPGPGSTVDLSSLGAAAISKPVTGKQRGAARPSTGPVKPSTGPVKPSTGPVRPGASRGAGTQQGENARLDVDDLFGMAELTGDAPLSADLDPPVPPPAPATKSAQFPVPSALADLDFDLDEPAPPKAARPPTAPERAQPPEPPPDSGEESLEAVKAPPAQAGPAADPGADLVLDDPFAQAVPPPAPDAGAALGDALATPPEARPKSEPVRAPAPLPRPPPPEREIAPVRAVIASALTGLLGAALAVVVVIASALSDDTAAGWLGFGPAAEVIATGVVSGLYDTAGGKPVFYVRGRVENRTGKVRGPVRVTAELVADGAPETKAETIAGSEPTAEDVWSVRSAAEADRLSRTLQSAPVERKVRPGGSLPFFALISEPPADLTKHRLHLRIETIDAWTPAGAKAARDK